MKDTPSPADISAVMAALARRKNANMTPEERSKSASHAVQARWARRDAAKAAAEKAAADLDKHTRGA